MKTLFLAITLTFVSFTSFAAERTGQLDSEITTQICKSQNEMMEIREFVIDKGYDPSILRKDKSEVSSDVLMAVISYQTREKVRVEVFIPALRDHLKVSEGENLQLHTSGCDNFFEEVYYTISPKNKTI